MQSRLVIDDSKKSEILLMKNCLKLVVSLAIGAVVGIVTYLNTKSDSVSNTRRDSDFRRPQRGSSRLDKINEDEVSESASPSNCSVRSENRDGFLEFLGNSQSGLEKILRILKNIALSLEYMAKLFANSGIRGALPPAYC